jgi:hypothetical protein
MSKIILEFDSVEEASEAQDAINGWKWRLVVYDLDQKLRETTKYESSIIQDTTASPTEVAIAEEYRTILRSLLENYKLNLED